MLARPPASSASIVTLRLAVAGEGGRPPWPLVRHLARSGGKRNYATTPALAGMTFAMGNTSVNSSADAFLASIHRMTFGLRFLRPFPLHLCMISRHDRHIAFGTYNRLVVRDNTSRCLASPGSGAMLLTTGNSLLGSTRSTAYGIEAMLQRHGAPYARQTPGAHPLQAVGPLLPDSIWPATALVLPQSLTSRFPASYRRRHSLF